MDEDDECSRVRADLDSCNARHRWPRDWLLAIIALCVGIVVGASLVAATPARWRCDVRCGKRTS